MSLALYRPPDSKLFALRSDQSQCVNVIPLTLGIVRPLASTASDVCYSLVVAVLDCHSQLLAHPIHLDAGNVIGPAEQPAKYNSVAAELCTVSHGTGVSIA
jgi:hypothetical protein